MVTTPQFRLHVALVVLGICAHSGFAQPAAEDPRPDEPVEDTRRAETDDWFWPDPFSHLGSTEGAGVGWFILKMGADPKVAKEIGETDEEQQAVYEIRQAIVNLDRNRRKAGQPLSKRSIIWDKGAETAKKVIHPARARRLEQLSIQRISYRAFRREDVVEHLGLTPEQQEKVTEIIAAHATRIKRRHQQTDDALEKFERTMPSADDLRDMQAKLISERGVYGRASHRKTWDNLRGMLTKEQQAAFNKLRGPRPSSMKSYLLGFPRMEDIEPPKDDDVGKWHLDDTGIEYRFRLASDKHSLEVPVLFYLDLRNAKGKHEIGLNLHQSQQHLYVNGTRYRYFGQSWGGTTRLDNKTVSIPFTLTDNWKTKQQGHRLILSPGDNIVSVELNLWDPPVSPWVGKKRSLPKPPNMVRFPPIRLALGLTSDLTGDDLALEKIRRELITLPADFHAPEVPERLRQLIHTSQPQSGDYLVSLVESDDEHFRQAAAVTIGNVWDSMTDEQLTKYLQAAQTHFIRTREVYPRGVKAMLAVGPQFFPGYLGMPHDRKYKAQSVTMHFLDGKPMSEEPYDYPSLTSTSKRLNTEKLKPGEHTIAMLTEYTVTRGDQVIRGTARSKGYTFKISEQDGPDDLLFPRTDEYRQLVESSFEIASAANEFEKEKQNIDNVFGDVLEVDVWSHQISWTNADGTGHSLHCPLWRLEDPLPVDLCFDVSFRLEDGTVLPGSSLTVLANEPDSGYLAPDYSVRAFKKFKPYADDDGFVKVVVVLKPSRTIALSNVKVKSYYGGEIESQPVRFRLDPPSNPLPRD